MNKTAVIEYFGSASKVAAALGISKSAVSKWGVTVPGLRAYQIERLTRGNLRVQDQPAHTEPRLRGEAA